MTTKLSTMRAIFKQGLAAAVRDGDMARAALYKECIKRMKGKAS